MSTLEGDVVDTAGALAGLIASTVTLGDDGAGTEGRRLGARSWGLLGRAAGKGSAEARSAGGPWRPHWLNAVRRHLMASS